MSAMKRCASTAILAFFTLLILMVLGVQFAWAEDDAFVAGSIAGDLSSLEKPDNLTACDSEEADSGDFETSDGFVGVYGITAGKVSYDPATQTLTANNLTASGVYLLKESETFTLNLVGENNTYVGVYSSAGDSRSLLVCGAGKLIGNVDFKDVTFAASSWETKSIEGTRLTIDGATITTESIVVDDLLVKSGTVKTTGRGLDLGDGYGASVGCRKNIEVAGGSLSTYDITAGSLTVSGGSLSVLTRVTSPNVTVSGGVLECNSVGCTNLLATGGSTVARTGIRFESMYIEGGDVRADGLYAAQGSSRPDLTVSSGGLSANSVHCASLTMSGGSVSSQGYVRIEKSLTLTGGAIEGDSVKSFGKFTIGGGTITAAEVSCISDIVVNAGTIKAIGKGGLIYSGRDLTVTGGSLVSDYRIVAVGNVTMSGGNASAKDRISCQGDMALNRGTLKGGSIMCSNKLTAGGAVINGAEMRAKNILVKAGKVSTSGKAGITATKSFSVTGGTIAVLNADYGIRVGSTETATHNFTVSGGTVSVSNPTNIGISVKAGNLIVKAGTVKVTGCYGSNGHNAIDVRSYEYREKTYGGRVAVTGGLLSSTVRNTNSGAAVYADSMSNKSSCLGTIVGRLPVGASIAVNGVNYVLKGGVKGKATKAAVSLASGNFSSLPNSVKFGKVSYGVDGFSPCATRMPVGSSSVWKYESSASSYKLEILTGKGVVSIKGRTVTALKPGMATVGLYCNGVKVSQRKVTVYALSGKYLMQSCMKGKSGMCLDMNGASKANGAQMIVWGKNGGKNQQFTFLKQKDGSYVIKSVNSGKVLDVNGASKSWGQNVIQWQANGGANQKWRISVDGANRATFTNVNSGLVFDVSGGKADWGAPMIQWGGNGGLNQKWSLVAVK